MERPSEAIRKLRECISNDKCEEEGCEYWDDLEEIENVLNYVDDIENRSLITCCYCANWIPGKGTDDILFSPPSCKRNGGVWPGDGFCSYAERNNDVHPILESKSCL